MPFEIIEQRRTAPKPKVAPGDIRVSTRGLPRDRGRMVTVAVGRAVAQSLRWRGGTKVSLAWGVGPDLGKLRISPHESGSIWEVKESKNGQIFRIHSAAIPEDMPALGESQLAPHEVLPGRAGAPFVTIKLPENVWKTVPGLAIEEAAE